MLMSAHSRPARVMSMIVRPPVAGMLCLFAALGMASGGETNFATLATCAAFLSVVLYFVNGAALNDIYDAEIDRTNALVAPYRALATGDLSLRQMKGLAWFAGGTTVVLGLAISPWAGLLLAVGVVLNVAYSMPPVRVCSRGALAAVLLPIFFTATPFLLGVLAAGGSIRSGGWILLVGIYVSYTGRGLLKDFRDVRGDILYGKRTFLIRHGRARTCGTSAGALIAGTTVLTFVAATPVVAIPIAGCLVAALLSLRMLALSRDAHRDNLLVAVSSKFGSVAALCMLSGLLLTPAAPLAVQIGAQVALMVYGATCAVLIAQPRLRRSEIWEVAEAA